MKRWALVVLLAVVTSCGDSSGPEQLTAERMATQFDRIGDDYARQGETGDAAMMRGLAVMLRATGRLTPVDMTIDGARSTGWYAIAIQQRLPEIPCPESLPFCEGPLPAQADRLILAWHGNAADRILIVRADTSGLDDFSFDIGDIETIDDAAMAIFTDRADDVAWLSDSGTVSSSYLRTGVDCPENVGGPEDAVYVCERAIFDIAIGLRAAELSVVEENPVQHRVTLTGSGIGGVLLIVQNWGTDDSPFGPRLPTVSFTEALQR